MFILVHYMMEFHPYLHTRRSPHRVTYARCRIDTIDSPDDEHMVARNTWSTETNIYGKEMCVKLVIYKNCTEMHGQQNTKFFSKSLIKT